MPSDEEPTGSEPVARDAYDALAANYDAETAADAYNAEWEFPATTALVPGVDGKRVLDAGCGTGRYTEWLLERGAEVVGIDASDAMLERAAERVGDRATLRRADLGDPLAFASDDSFDGVVSGLALDYVRDWRDPFDEFARILRPGGFLAFSVAHPMDAFPEDGDANYYETERRTKEWAVDVPFYRRPFSEAIDPLLETGFRLEAVDEPRPTAGFAERRPERYERESNNPVFCCVRAVKP